MIEVSEKNIQAYKKKDEVPNVIASVVICFAHMNKNDIDYKELISFLGLKKKSKPNSGFTNKMKT